MAKGRKKNHFKVPTPKHVLISNFTEDLDRSVTSAPNQTPTTINNYWMADSTTAEEVTENKDENSDYAATWSALTDKGLRGKLQISPGTAFLITIILWAISCAYLFLADNQFGRLDSIDGMKWLVFKATFLSLFFIIILFLLIIYSWLIQDPSQSKRQKEQ